MTSGERVTWPIHPDPRNQERYFAVIADCQSLSDIVAAAGHHRANGHGGLFVPTSGVAGRLGRSA